MRAVSAAIKGMSSEAILAMQVGERRVVVQEGGAPAVQALPAPCCAPRACGAALSLQPAARAVKADAGTGAAVVACSPIAG